MPRRLTREEIDSGSFLADEKPMPIEEIKKYLDGCISYWRGYRDSRPENKEMGSHYVDAFASARISIFGGKLARRGKDVLADDSVEQKDAE